LTVFPNPSRGEVFINLPDIELKNAELKIMDLDGKTIIVTQIGKGERNISVNMPKFKSGIFLIQVVGDNFFQSTRLLIE
jgi:hypothetical protein